MLSAITTLITVKNPTSNSQRSVQIYKGGGDNFSFSLDGGGDN